MDRRVLGVVFGATSAFLFGTTVVVGRNLARADLPFEISLGIPFSLGGVLLLLGLAAARRPTVPSPGEWKWILFLGVVVYGVESAFFFSGLERGTAAAVTLLFYLYPAVVVLSEIPLRRRLPSALTAGAVALSIVGAATIVSAEGSVDITGTGVAFTLAAAVMFTANLLVSERTVRVTSSVTAAAWLALGTGVGQLAWGTTVGSLADPSGHWWALLGLAAVRAGAFVFMFAALRRLGPADTSVTLTLEALFAVLLAAAFIDESISGPQAVGGAAILAAAVIIARRPDVEPAGGAAPPP